MYTYTYVYIYIYICVCIYIYIWEVLLGTRLLGATFGRGLLNHQAATAQMHLVEANTYRRVPTPLRTTSPFSECQLQPINIEVHRSNYRST